MCTIELLHVVCCHGYKDLVLTVLTFGFALNDDDNCGLFIMYLRTHSVFVQR